jgi:hypothetical protein
VENKPDCNNKQIAEDIDLFLPFYIPVSPTINQTMSVIRGNPEAAFQGRENR